MKLKALVTSLILSASSVALADHDTTVTARYANDLAQRDHRPWRPQWTPLAAQVTAHRRNVIRIDERRDDVRALRLKSTSGATYIYSLTLYYDNGTHQSIRVGKWLYGGAPILTFDVAQQRGGIDRIVVNTWTSIRSTYEVLGQRVRERPLIAQPVPPPPPPFQNLPQLGVVLGSNLTFANTAGYVHLPVGAEKGTFHKLRIESTGSGTFVGRIYVTFPSGLHQMFEINRALYRGETLDLDLEGTAARPITAVTVMQGNDVRAVGPSASRFAVTLL